MKISLNFLEICSKHVFVWVWGFFSRFDSFELFRVAEKMSAKYRCDTMVSLFMSAIMSAFAECQCELERLDFSFKDFSLNIIYRNFKMQLIVKYMLYKKYFAH